MFDTSVSLETARAENSPQLDLRSLSIGPLPLPIFVALAAIVGVAAYTDKLPNDVIGGLAVLMLIGFLLGKLGQTIPVLKDIGGTAILCLFVPSALVGYHVMPDPVLKAIAATFKTANFQYFYIACLVAGSILGMPRKVLIQGFMKMFVPLLIGTLGAISAGILVGLAFGHNPNETFFFILIPIVGGGLAEGVLPLSIAYSEILHQPQAQLVAHMVPAALLGNVAAIVSAGVLARIAEKIPSINGKGMLVRTGDDNELLTLKAADVPLSLSLMGAGLMLSCGFFILGGILAPYTGIPGPILMIICAVIAKVARIMPAEMEQGAYQINRFMATNLTFAILTAMGTMLVSWQQLVASFNIGYLAICASAVLAMIASGFFVGKWLNMYPTEAAIVTACHSGLGGTGDVAILGAANRMGLMAFAQVATRVGGAIVIVSATFAMKLAF